MEYCLFGEIIVRTRIISHTRSSSKKRKSQYEQSGFDNSSQLADDDFMNIPDEIEGDLSFN